MRILSTLILSTLISFAYGQISLEVVSNNGTPDIKDGTISVKVKGGQAPFKFVWSDNAVSYYQSYAKGLEEGKEYSIKVFDVNGDSAKVKHFLPARSAQEKINANAKPTVDFVAQGVFWDPFASLGIYDPTIYIDRQMISCPVDNDTLFGTVIFEELITANPKKGEAFALLRTDAIPIHLFATGPGKVNLKVKPGDTLKYTNAKGEVVIKGKDVAEIVYNEPQPALEANGTEKGISIPLVVVWLVLGAIFFTIYMKFVNFRGAKHAIELVQGKYDDPNEDHGEVSHFQALTTALSGTVGLGNIASVAIAIAAGGPGATFWMILAGLLGMSSKFVECTLGVKYREIDKDDGEVHGGPMYYLSKGLAKRNLKGLGKILAAIFAVLCIGGSFGGGNMFQANQAFAQFSEVAGLQGGGVIFGVVLALLVGIVIIGGIKNIAKVTDKIVPFMVGVYVLVALIIIFINIGNIGNAFGAIFDGAFNADALKGGILGVLIIGFQRAAFSNEAGVGSASIAHSAAKTKEPVSEGIVALLEPFIDTVVVCTMTALVLIFTGYAEDTQGLSGANLTSAAFSQRFIWFKYVLTIAIMLFAFSTMISWSYYGLKAWTYLFGRTKAMDYTYKAIFLVFVVIGSSISLGAVLDFSDMMVLGMAFPNILGMILLAPEVKADMVDYFARVKSGAIKKFK
jgi:AGCS family alanine or glycine:cation symporter